MKHFFISTLLFLVMSSVASAQFFETTQEAKIKSSDIGGKVKETLPSKKVGEKAVVHDNAQTVVESVKLPPTEMTVEQKAEIDLSLKKDIRSNVKKQPVRERKDVIVSLIVGEKVLTRRKALLEGKTEEDAVNAAEQIKEPEINPAVDAEMENFLYQRAGLNNE